MIFINTSRKLNVEEKAESAFHPNNVIHFNPRKTVNKKKRLIKIMFALLLDIEFYGVSSRNLTIVIKK